MSGGLEAEVVRDIASCAPFETGWRGFAEAQGNAFISPDWYRAWAELYGDATQPAIVVVRDRQGALRGVLPLAAASSGRPRRWGFGGANLGDLFSPACAPGDEATIARCAAVALEAAGAELLVLDNVAAAASWWHGLARRSTGSDLAAYTYRQSALPRIELAGLDWAGYLASRSRNLRSQIGRKTRALERDHGLQIRLAEPATLVDDLGSFFRLHEARWADRGGSGSLNARTREFHEIFARMALDRGWLRLWTLELDGVNAASWYGWRIGDAYCYYLAGFEPRFFELSVGFVLLAHTIRAAAEEACASYELLLGEESYKARFATTEQPVETAVLIRRSHPMRAVIAAETGLWRLSRRLPPSALDRARRSYRVLSSRLPTARRR